MQQQLKDLGYLITRVDGTYGPETTRAVNEFLADASLSPDSGGLAIMVAVDARYAHVFDSAHA